MYAQGEIPGLLEASVEYVASKEVRKNDHDAMPIISPNSMYVKCATFNFVGEWHCLAGNISRASSNPVQYTLCIGKWTTPSSGLDLERVVGEGEFPAQQQWQAPTKFSFDLQLCRSAQMSVHGKLIWKGDF